MLNPKLFADAFPINKVEVFFDAEDHSDFLGFQWEMISQGRMPIGLNVNDSDFNEIGKTGGEKEHILTVEEMPSHSHELYGSGTGGSDSSLQRVTNNGIWDANKMKETGGGKPHNNMPPYIVMAFWKRVA